MRVKEINLNKPASVAASYYNGALEFARRLSNHHSVSDQWLQAYTIDERQHRIEAHRYAAFLDAASDHLKEPCFGLKYGIQIDISAFNLLGYLAMSSATLKDASKIVNQYGVLVSEIGHLEVEYQENDLVKVVWQLRPEYEDCSTQVVDGVLAGWISFGKKFLGGNVQLARVNLTERSIEKTSYQKCFDCPVFIGEKDNAIFISREYFESPLQQAEPLVHSAIQFKAEQAVQEINSFRLDLTEQILRELPYLIFNEKATVEQVAQRLSLTTRSLQRKLKQHNIHFRDLLDRTRRALAVKLLLERELPIANISSIVGFNDQSSFNRAFKRWTGQTPRQFQLSHSRSISTESIDTTR